MVYFLRTLDNKTIVEADYSPSDDRIKVAVDIKEYSMLLLSTPPENQLDLIGSIVYIQLLSDDYDLIKYSMDNKESRVRNKLESIFTNIADYHNLKRVED